MTRTILALIIVSLSILNASAGLAQRSIQQAQSQSEAAEAPELVEARQLSQRVVVLAAEKKYDEALPLAKRALELREKKLGKEHPSVGDALENLAYLYQQKGKYSEAESLYKRRLSIAEKAFGRDSLRLTSTLGQLAWLSYALRDNGRAEELFVRALLITEKALGPNHAETARALFNIGLFHERATQYGKALAYYRRALDIIQQTLGPEHEEVRSLLGKCACALRLDGKDAEAEEYERRSRVRRDPAPESGTRVGGGVLQGHAITRVQPTYPAEAKATGLAGTVVVEVTVDEDGRVINAKVTCGPGLLAGAALTAARQWIFSPTKLSGRPVKVIGTISFHFTL